MKLNKNERRQTSFPQVWKQLPYFLVKSDASKHLISKMASANDIPASVLAQCKGLRLTAQFPSNLPASSTIFEIDVILP